MVQKCGSAKRNVDRLQCQRVDHLPPVGGNHVGGCRQSGGAAELGHHFAAGKAVFGAAGVFGVRDDVARIAHQANGVLEQPAAVRIERHTRLRKALVQRGHGGHFVLAAQHAALELEIVETVPLVTRLGETDHGLGRERRFVAHPRPVVLRIRRGHIAQVRLRPVADEEQVPEHLDPIALLTLAQQRGDRHIEILAEQVEKRRLERGDSMDRDAQIEGLQAATPGIPVSELLAGLLQDGQMVADGPTDEQAPRVIDGLADSRRPGLRRRRYGRHCR